MQRLPQATMNGDLSLSLGDLDDDAGAGAPRQDLADIKGDLAALGLVLEHGPAGFAVQLVQNGSAADQCGQVQRGDIVAEYNSVAVQLVGGAPAVRPHGIRSGKFVFLRVRKNDGTFVECAIERDPYRVPGAGHNPNAGRGASAQRRSAAAATAMTVGQDRGWSTSLKVDHTARPPAAIEKSSPGIRSPIRSISRGLGKMRWKAYGDDGSPGPGNPILVHAANGIKNHAPRAQRDNGASNGFHLSNDADVNLT